MTTVYKDYYDAYDAGKFDIHNVNFIAKLVTEDYNPNYLDKVNDVKPYFIVSVGALKGDVLATKSMSELMDIMKSKILDEIYLNSEEIFKLIDEVYIDKQEKASNLKRNLTLDVSTNISYNYWDRLKEDGIKYFVVESPNLKILCFCEEIM